MEPRREEQKVLETGAEQRASRFRIVKLEDRIAPAKGGKGTNNCGMTSKFCSGDATCWCTWGCWPW